MRVNKWWPNFNFWVRCSFQQTEFLSSLCKNAELKVMEVERINTKCYWTTLVSLLLPFYSRNANEKGEELFEERWRRSEETAGYNLSLCLAHSFFTSGSVYTSENFSRRQNACFNLLKLVDFLMPDTLPSRLSSLNFHHPAPKPLIRRSKRFINGL